MEPQKHVSERFIVSPYVTFLHKRYVITSFLILWTVFDTRARSYVPPGHMSKVPIILSHRRLSGRYRVSLKYSGKPVQRL